MKNKDPQNCPYCQAEEKGYSTGWSFSPEGWQMAKEKHLRKHCDKCPFCGQEIEKLSVN